MLLARFVHFSALEKMSPGAGEGVALHHLMVGHHWQTCSN